MVQATGAPIAQYFAALDDPRIDRTKRQDKLLDIVTIALCATIAGTYWPGNSPIPWTPASVWRRWRKL